VVTEGAITAVEGTTTDGVVAIITGTAIGDASTRFILVISEEAAVWAAFFVLALGDCPSTSDLRGTAQR